MGKKLLLAYLLICTSFLGKAQIQAHFDGKNDYAKVTHHPDLSIGAKQDFTFEFFISPENLGRELILLSKFDSHQGLILSINEDGLPTMSLNGQLYFDHRIVWKAGEACIHLAFARKKGNLYIFLSGDWVQVGSNSADLSNKADLHIGNNPYRRSGYYAGQIDEIRFWNYFRSNDILNDEAYKCLLGNETGLIANWQIQEGTGQVFHDVAGFHHARMGNDYSSDQSDPEWADVGCRVLECCPTKAYFSYSGNLTENQPVTFTNQSSYAYSYAWYIDGVLVSTNTNLTHTFSAGEYLVSLVAYAKSGCRRVYSLYLEVAPATQLEFCGGMDKTYTDSLGDDFYYDRFGNRYTGRELAMSSASSQGMKQAGQATYSTTAVSTCDCQTDFGISTSYFELYFEDCMMGTGSGFDDPVFGADRRRTVCQVYSDLSQLIQQTSPNCGGAAEKVRIRVMPSQANGYYGNGTALQPLPAGIAGVASPYSHAAATNGIQEGFPWKVITTGEEPVLMPTFGATSYHGYVRINFHAAFPWHLDSTQPVPLSEMDLYTVTLHESLHMLGFASSTFYDTSSSSWTSRISTTATGGFSNWDRLIKRASGNLAMIQNTTGFDWDFNSGLSLPNDLLNSCNGIDLTIGTNNVALYTGASYNAASSMSHVDETCNGNTNTYVMHPTISTGVAKRTISTDELSLLTDLGYTLTGSTTCTVVGTGDTGNGCNGSFYQMDACSGNSLLITYADITSNDINVTGIHQIEVVNGAGTVTAITGGNPQTDYNFAPLGNFPGIYYIRYIPTGCGGQLGNETYIRIEVEACGDCAFQDVPKATNANPNVIIAANCNTTATSPKCVDCGINKNPNNLVCNPEFCGGALANWNIMYLCGISPNYFEMPGWNLASGFPIWYARGNIGAARPNFHPNSGGMAIGTFVQNSGAPRQDGVYTSVAVQQNERYFTSSYTFAHNQAFTSGTVDFELELVTDNAKNTYFTCSYISPGLPVPPIPTADRLLINSLTHQVSPANNNLPYQRSGNVFTIPAGFTGSNLYAHTKMDANQTEAHMMIDQIELIHDDFTAGPDQNLVCGQTIDLGGVDFGMLSDVRVQYTWTNTLTGNVELDYWVERELSGNLMIFDLISNAFISQIPVLTVSPPQTTTYSLTRTFLLDTDNTFGGLPANTFNNAPLMDDVEITVPSAPVANPAFTFVNTACGEYQFTSDPTSVGANFSHSWDFDGDGNLDNFDPNPNYSFSSNGTFTVTHYVNNGCGTFTSSQTVTVTAAGSPLAFPIEVRAANGGTGGGFPTATAVGSDSSIYVIGIMSGDIELVSGTGTVTITQSNPCFSLFVAKYTTCGAQWAQEIPACAALNMGFQQMPDIEVDANDNVYVSFSFTNSFQFNGSTYTSAGGADIAFAKFDAMGNPVWAKRDGGVEHDYIAGIALYENTGTTQLLTSGILLPLNIGQNTVATGNSASIAGASQPYYSIYQWFSQNPAAIGVTFTAAYTDAGTTATPNWARFLGNPTNYLFTPTMMTALEVDQNGNSYVGGLAFEGFSFTNLNTTNASSPLPSVNSAGTSINKTDNFILSYDINGNERWAALYGTQVTDISSSEVSPLGIDFAMNSSTNQLYAVLSNGITASELVRFNAGTGGVSSSQFLANTQPAANHPNFNGVYLSRLALDQNSNVVTSGNFMIGNGSPAATNVDFHSANGGQNILLSNTSAATSPHWTNEYYGWFVEKFDANTNFSWVLPNTSITPTSSPNSTWASNLVYDVDVSPSGDVYTSLFLDANTTMDLNTTNYSGGNGFSGYIVRVQNPGSGPIYAKSAQEEKLDQLENRLVHFDTKVYPNPTNSSFTVEFATEANDLEISSLELLDLTGRSISQFKVRNTSQRLFNFDMSQQPTGIYLIRAVVGEKVVTKRVMVVK